MKQILIQAAGLFTAALFATSSTALAQSAQDFVNKVAISDMFEIQSSQLALSKQADEDTKPFAQKMVQDHQKTSSELKAVVEGSMVKLTLPATTDSEHQKMLNDLQAKDGKDFDRTYDQIQLKAHQDAVALFESYSKNGDNPELKSWAVATLPHLKEHLSMAQKVAPRRSVSQDGGDQAAPPLRRFVQRDKWRPSNELLQLTRADLLEHPTESKHLLVLGSAWRRLAPVSAGFRSAWANPIRLIRLNLGLTDHLSSFAMNRAGVLGGCRQVPVTGGLRVRAKRSATPLPWGSRTKKGDVRSPAFDLILKARQFVSSSSISAITNHRGLSNSDQPPWGPRSFQVLSMSSTSSRVRPSCRTGFDTSTSLYSANCEP